MLHHNADQARAQELGSIIIEILNQRKRELRGDNRARSMWLFPNGVEDFKTFTYSQLRELVYRSFAELRRGDIKTPPPRSTVMQIADYLECSLTERNHLLRVCQHALVPPYETGDTLRTALDVAESVLQSTSLPAYIITRDWDIHCVNEAMLSLMDLSLQNYRALKPYQRNIIQMIYDRTLPVRAQLEVSEESWRSIAARNIFGFKYENMFCEFEPWYIERVRRWKDLDGFDELWNTIDTESSIDDDENQPLFPFYLTTLQTREGSVTFRSLLTSFGNYNYPQVVMYQPIGEDSKAVYHALHIEIPSDNKIYWGCEKSH